MAVTDEVFSKLNFGGMFQSTTTVLFWALLLTVAGLLIWFIWWMFSFRIKIIIREAISKSYYYKPGATTAFTDLDQASEEDGLPGLSEENEKIRIVPNIISFHRAKIVTKKGVKRLQLFFPSKRLKLPEQAYHTITKRGKKCIELVKVSEHLYMPSVLSDQNLGTVKTIFDEGYVDWLVRDIESDNSKYRRETFWTLYGQHVMNLGTLALCMIIIVVTLKYSNEIVESARPIADAFVEATKALSKALTTQNV